MMAARAAARNVNPGLASGADYNALEYYRDPEAQLSSLASMSGADPELVGNLILESGYLANDLDLNYLRDQQQLTSTLQTYAYSLMTAFEQENLPFRRKAVENARQTIEYAIGYQHSEVDEEAIVGEGRTPYAFNVIKPVVRSMMGEIAMQKTRGRAIARNARSGPKAEIGDKILQWIAQDNKLDRVRALVARDGFLQGVGFAGIRMHPHDPQGRIKIERVRQEECMWDVNSTPNSVSDTKYFWRMSWHDRVTLAAEYPEKALQILNATGDFTTPRAWEADYAMVRPKARSTAGSGDYTNQFQSTFRQLYGRLLVKREFYVRRTVPRLAITDPFTNQTWKFQSPDEAYAKQRQLEAQYMMTPVWTTLSPRIQESLFSARAVQIEVVDQFIFIGNVLVRVNSTSECGIPYIPFHPEYFDGDTTPYLDYLKDPQRWLNRSVSMLDQIFAGTKGGYVINRRWFNSQWSDEEIMDRLNQTNWKMLFNELDPDFDASKIVHYVQEHHNTSELMSMVSFVQSFTTQTSGGANRQGLSAFAGQSARSAEDLRAAGSNQMLEPLDCLREWQDDVMTRALVYAQALHPAAELRVFDEDKTPEFFSLLTAGIQSLEDYAFDVATEEVKATPTERQARYERLMNLAGQLGPKYAAKIVPMALKNADFDYSERKELTAALEAEGEFEKKMQATQLAAQVEESRAKQVARSVELYLKARSQSFTELNLPKLLMNGDISKLPPATLATLLNWAGLMTPMTEQQGMVAHPAMLMADQSAQSTMRLGSLAMMQTMQNELTPAWEKEAVANKVAVHKGYPSAKDETNRATREIRNGRSQ